MADSVVVRITENRLIVTKEDKKVTVAAPYVKNENNYTARLVILGYYDTLSDLTTAVTSPSEGDPYGVGTEAPYTIYIWTGTEWKDNGTLKGEKGDPTEWIRGTVDPTTEGIDGDLYLNYATWHVWEKISGAWEDKGTIKGADGGGVPAISTGDAGKFLKVNATGTDTEWTTADASKTVKGVVKVGANVNVTDGVISVPDASNTVKGVVELATPDEVKQGTDNERAVTPAGFKAAYTNLVSPAMTGSATLNGTTNNTVQLTDIVTTLGLEVGDVIRIKYSGYDKLHSVESITNNNSIIVNYEHAGNRGNGSLKLEDKTADEVYDLDLGGATGGTFTLGDGSSIETTELAYNATTAQIQTALNTAYSEDGIVVVANGEDFVITFPTGVTATLTLDATSLTGATNPAVTLRAVTITRIAKWFNAPIGLGQAWVNVTGSRVAGTTYTNTTGRTIVVLITVKDSGSGKWFYSIDGIEVDRGNIPGGTNSVTLLVPDGQSYGGLILNGNVIVKWLEVR